MVMQNFSILKKENGTVDKTPHHICTNYEPVA